MQYVPDLEDLKLKGADSKEAIEVGIDHLRNMARCVCEGTAREKMYSIQDMLNIGITECESAVFVLSLFTSVKRGISAYKVGCDNAMAPHAEDANDQFGHGSKNSSRFLYQLSHRVRRTVNEGVDGLFYRLV